MVAVVVNVIPTNQKELTADSPAKFILTCPKGAEATVRNPSLKTLASPPALLLTQTEYVLVSCDGHSPAFPGPFLPFPWNNY